MPLIKAAGHRGEQLRTHVRPCPRAHGNADPTRCRFSEVWDALIEVHIPALLAADQLLVFDNGARRTRVGADLAGLAEFVPAESVGRSGHQRHVGRDTGKTYTRSEVPADQ